MITESLPNKTPDEFIKAGCLTVEIHQGIQADLLSAINNQVEVAKNKLEYALTSMDLGEYTLMDARDEMAAALRRIEAMDKLTAMLSLVASPQAAGPISAEALRPIENLCRYIIESIDKPGGEI